MSAPLADALRRLGLPLDETIDEGELGDAYRRAARENHPDGAPDEERERRGESMREINAARDLVRLSLELLSERPYTEISERDNGTPAPAWWEDAIFEDPSGLGVRWNPGAVRIPWRQRFEQARLALCIAVGDTVTVEQEGVLTLARVEAFDSSVRVSRRTVWAGLPVELRRIGVEVRFPDGSRRHGRCRRRARGGLALPGVRPDEHARRAARAAVSRAASAARASTTTAGTTSAAAGAGCIAGCASSIAARRRSRPAARLRSGTSTTASPTRAVASSRWVPRSRPWTPRSHPPRRASPRRSCAGLAHAHGRRRRAPASRAGAPCHRGQARAQPRATGPPRCSTSSARASSSSTASARASSASCARATRRASAPAAAARPSATRSATAALRELRTVEIELGAVAPDAIALLGGFESWRQAPDKWLVEDAG